MDTFLTVCVSLAAMVWTMSCGLAVEPAPPTEDLRTGPAKGPWRRLFLDAMVVEEQHGLKRVFHAARKFEGNPVIRGEKPWEKAGGRWQGPDIYGTVMWDEGRLRMWYRCYTPAAFQCYAESKDGIHWTKPNLGLREYKGSTDTNIYLSVAPDSEGHVPNRSSGQCNFAHIVKRPWEKDPEKRYALFCYALDYRKHRAAFSADGLNWKFVAETAEKGIIAAGDASNYFYDPYQNRYVATRKMWSRRGRSVGVAWAKDELNWTVPTNPDQPVFVPDDLDPDATQFYGMPVFPYQGLYIGLIWVYHARVMKYGPYTDARLMECEQGSPCTTDVQLAWSWDLISWTRPPERQPFVGLGKESDFDCSQIHTANAPVPVGDDLYFYYGGWDGRYKPLNTGNIGLAMLRLDGFCSMHAGEQEGWLITRREPLDKPTVTLNAKVAPGGHVVAEILDRNN
ncbi:MAG: hypothetical protein FJ279_15715, partial [Planctomycetes bacterium]|nr:hypothetical protein [Planctomycetota bacterium]